VRWVERKPALAGAVIALFLTLAAGLFVAVVLLGQKNAALTEKQEALTKERRTATEKAAALADYDRLADLPRLHALRARAAQLGPAHPENAGPMRTWLAEAAALERTFGAQREALASLRRSALAYSPEDQKQDREAHLPPEIQRAQLEEERASIVAALDRAEEEHDGAARRWAQTSLDSITERISLVDERATQRLTWRFEDGTLQFKHDTLAKFVLDMAEFLDADPKKGAVASVRERLAFAERVKTESIEKYDAKWHEAIASIAHPTESPLYAGLKVTPQIGLIPIGRNSQSGLWEFLHLQTCGPGAHPIPERDEQTGHLRLTDSVGLVFVLIPGGAFRMGGERIVDPNARDDEGPPRDVALDPFFISKYEMTQAQWRRFNGGTASGFSGPMNPMEQVSWNDCAHVMGALALQLPTEAQWEYAARAGTTTPWWCGGDKECLREAGNIAESSYRGWSGRDAGSFESWDDGYGTTAPVGSFRGNAFGLHDVHGNVWEWCRDAFAPPTWPVAEGDGLRRASTSRRVMRGGGFSNDASLARLTYRDSYPPDFRILYIGLRPARHVCRD
jgi:formylglycine-generating enzyme required for sulfatase activity